MFSESELDLIAAPFQAHYGYVIGVVYRYAPSKDLVDDVMQEVFIDFLTGFAEKKWSLDQKGGSSNWRPLLCHLAKRRAQLYARRQKRKKRLVDRVAERLQQASGIVSDDPLKSDEEAFSEIERQVAGMRHCLEKLPPKSRALVEQYYFDHVPMKTIAEHQGSTLATIQNFFYRVRIKLRECIEKEGK